VTASSAGAALVKLLRADLAPTPARWQRSMFIGLGTMTALVLAWSLQVPSFAAPALAFMALQPANEG
jgi:hypothetical protein